MNSRRLLCTSVAFAVFALLPISAFADKISTQDFEELRKGSKMSEVIAAVGQPASKKDAPPVFGGMIEWHYPNIPSATNGKPVYVKLFFDKNTERLETMGIY